MLPLHLRRQLAELRPLAAVLLLHLSCPTESQWTGAIAYSSFEEPVALATATPITDRHSPKNAIST